MKYQSAVYKSEEGKKILLDLYDRQLAQIPVPYTEKTVSTRFGSTHLVMYGNSNGIPVLGFHGGNATNPYSLKPFVENVDMDKIYFIVPDTIGNIGYSSENKLSSANLDYGKWACDILDALQIESIAVFGGSYGAGMAIRLASYAPKRVSKLMLVIPSGIANAIPFQMMKIGIPTLMYMLNPSSDEKLRKAVSRMAPNLDEPFFEMIKLSILNSKFEMVMPRNAKKSELADFNAPTFVIAEEKDCLFPGKKVLKQSEKIFNNLVGTCLVSYGGHGAFMLAKDENCEVYRLLTNFFTKE